MITVISKDSIEGLQELEVVFAPEVQSYMWPFYDYVRVLICYIVGLSNHDFSILSIINSFRLQGSDKHETDTISQVMSKLVSRVLSHLCLPFKIPNRSQDDSKIRLVPYGRGGMGNMVRKDLTDSYCTVLLKQSQVTVQDCSRISSSSLLSPTPQRCMRSGKQTIMERVIVFQENS